MNLIVAVLFGEGQVKVEARLGVRTATAVAGDEAGGQHSAV
jgi:hypothetical protein